jgi:eukaryotic-like serine/threonine-protein kinase
MMTNSGLVTTIGSPKDQNRSAMLGNIRRFWVDGVLKDSLYHKTCNELGMQPQPKEVQYLPTTPPEQMALHDEEPKTITIDQAFNWCDSRLLILGAPGCGKTTVLLQLAESLLEAAEHDPQEPIPVVFNLASYANNRSMFYKWLWESDQLSLERYLINDLTTKYYVPEPIAKEWVEGGQLTLLLDGLDEVVPEHREACVGAINTFTSTHPTVKLAVCSRRATYQALSQMLDLKGQVVAQPLTIDQIDNFLGVLGPRLEGLRRALDTDIVLLKLMQTPLLLNMAIWAYKDCDVEQLRTHMDMNSEQRRKLLIGAYIQRVLREKTTTDTSYPHEQTVHWLSCLARKMQQNTQSIFHLEMIQLNWLETKAQRRLYFTLPWLIGGLLLLLSIATFAIAWRFVDLETGFGAYMALLFLLFSVVGAWFLITSVGLKKEIEIDESLTVPRQELTRILLIGIAAILICILLARIHPTVKYLAVSMVIPLLLFALKAGAAPE